MSCFDFNSNAFKHSGGVRFFTDKPAVPFFYKLNKFNGGLQPNTTFIIQGFVEDNATRFQVDLTAGHAEKSDIVFHFNPRLDKLYAARNSRFSGAWGPEEGASQLKFPFRCGQPFYLEIYTTNVSYLVAVDGVHYCTYKHRAPVASVSGVRVTGGVRLSQVLLLSAPDYPSALPQFLPVPDTKPALSTANQAVSVVYNLSSPLQVQLSIIVQGVVNDNADRFEVNFLNPLTDEEDPDIGFHFNPRFERKYTVRNTRLMGKWGSEEGAEEEKFPFRQGQPFYLEIYVTPAKFLIAVDGQHYASYRHRVPPKTLSKIHVRGGVTLTSVHVKDSSSYPCPPPKVLSGGQEDLQFEDLSRTSATGLKVPFTQKLTSRLQPQSTLVLQGAVNSNATRFSVDFIIGDEESPDIAFHLNPRLDEYVVTRNSRINCSWGGEERESERKFPFRFGQPFFLEIFFTETKFMVAVDGVHYCSYKYRTPLVSVTRLCVQGGVTLSQLMLNTCATYPSPVPEYLPCPDLESAVLFLASDEDKLDSFHHKLTSRLVPQSSLVIQAEVINNGIRFAVNFLIGEGGKDIAFHFNPRLPQGYTARNAKLRGIWGPEEGNAKEKFPFRNGFPFNLEIFFTHEKFMVAVDGEHYCSFKYRVPLAKVTSVQVEGGVKVKQVLVHPTASYPSAVLEFIPQPESSHVLQAVRTNSMSSISTLVPFYHELRSSLHPQSSIIVQGLVDCRAIRLEVNLMMGRGQSADVALHFNPRLDQCYTARNSRVDGSWGVEENNSYHRFPFVRGRPFYMEIFLTHSEFLVAVNGLHYCSYAYRAQLSGITCVEVCGVRDAQLDVLPGTSYPRQPQGEVLDSPYKVKLTDLNGGELPSQITPLLIDLKGKLNINSKIEIVGKVQLLPLLFYINLQDGSDYWPHPLVPFHVSVRFEYPGRKIIANTWSRKKWGDEKAWEARFPFIPWSTFTMAISCLDDKYVVHVDDQPLIAYKHRVPYSTVNTLLICGDVFISSVNVRL